MFEFSLLSISQLARKALLFGKYPRGGLRHSVAPLRRGEGWKTVSPSYDSG